MTEEMTDYVLRDKGATQTPDLKSFNSKISFKDLRSIFLLWLNACFASSNSNSGFVEIECFSSLLIWSKERLFMNDLCLPKKEVKCKIHFNNIFFFLSYDLFTLRLIYHSKDLWRHTPLLTNIILKNQKLFFCRHFSCQGNCLSISVPDGSRINSVKI